jgi:hypothetical protein
MRIAKYAALVILTFGAWAAVAGLWRREQPAPVPALEAPVVATRPTPAPTPPPPAPAPPRVDKRANQACAELRQLGHDVIAGDVFGSRVVERTDYIGQIGKRVDVSIAPAVAKAADNLQSTGRLYSVGAPASYVEKSMDRMASACDAYDAAKQTGRE